MGRTLMTRRRHTHILAANPRSATVNYVAIGPLVRAVVTLVVAGSHQGQMQSQIDSPPFRNDFAPQVELSHWGSSVGEYGWFQKTQGAEFAVGSVRALLP